MAPGAEGFLANGQVHSKWSADMHDVDPLLQRLGEGGARQRATTQGAGSLGVTIDDGNDSCARSPCCVQVPPAHQAGADDYDCRGVRNTFHSGLPGWRRLPHFWAPSPALHPRKGSACPFTTLASGNIYTPLRQRRISWRGMTRAAASDEPPPAAATNTPTRLDEA